MIIKHFELNKIQNKGFNYFLFYGKNEGLQDEILIQNFTSKFESHLIKYEENEFISNFDSLLEEFLNFSLFGESKIFIISRASEKICKYIEVLLEKKIKDIKIICKSGPLEKRSKLRNFFEKDKNLIITPFYEDDVKSLTPIIMDFLSKNNIKLSRESINLLINRSSGSRNSLKIELDKILNYSFTNKNIHIDNLKKLTNLAENYAVNELADHYLSKNTKGIAKILNENNYSDEDCILILRTILNRSKRLLRIIEKLNPSVDLDEVISNTRPPIFWKDKENVKKQVKAWKIEDLKNKIIEISETEVLIKSNLKNSLNIVSDFIINI